MIENKEEILKDYKKIIKTLGDTSKLEKEKLQLENEAEVLVELIKRCIEQNAHSALKQDEYENKYNELANKYQEVKNGIEEVESKISSQKIKFNNMKDFIERLEEQEGLITEFDEEIFNYTIKNIVLKSNHIFKFIFRDLSEININM